MIPGVIARRYAKALLELGSESGQLDTLVEEVQRVAATYDGSPELRLAISDPVVPIAAKEQILTEIGERLALGQTTKNALFLLLHRRRMPALSAISQRLREMADDKRGILRAEVWTAMPLAEDYFAQLQQQLERVTGRRIALDRKLDPALIGGVVARVGDTVYDGSLIARLRKMKESMLPN